MIGTIIGSIVAILVIIAAVATVVVLKIKKKGCFKVKEARAKRY